MAKEKYTAQEVIDALSKSAGLQTEAARMLGCTRQTIAKYIERYPTVKDAYDDARERILDLAESALYQQVKKGNMTAIIFILKTQGAKRGYIERRELTGAGADGAINIRVIREDTGD